MMDQQEKADRFDEILNALAGDQPIIENGEVSDIKICKLPYQYDAFVHGCRRGRDVWLRNDGQWTEEETDERCAIPTTDGITITSI